MLTLVLFTRPFGSTQGNLINILIHSVRVIFVVFLVVFAEGMGVAQSTKTLTAVVLIVLQSVLTVFLAIVITVNAILICIRPNPQEQRIIEIEKVDLDVDDSIPRELHNPTELTDRTDTKTVVISHSTVKPHRDEWLAPEIKYRRRSTEHDGLVLGAASPAVSGHSRTVSWASSG